MALPLHWSTFDLALHGWTEPIERVLAAAPRGEGASIAVNDRVVLLASGW